MVNFYRYKPIDIQLVRQAWEKAFNRDYNAHLWQEFWDWSFGKKSMSSFPYVAYIEIKGVIASFIGVIPVSIIYKSTKIVNGGLAVAGFTHPSFQGQGLYKELYSEALPTFREWGIELMVAFDNHNSHYPEVKHLAWKDVGLLTEFSWSASTNRIHTCHNKYSVSSDALVSSHLHRVSQFHVSTNSLKFSRDYDYLKWRLLDKPHVQYNYVEASLNGCLCSAMIYKYYKKRVVDAMELFHVDATCIDWNAVAAIVDYLNQIGVEKINIWSALKTEEHLQLEKMGFEEKQFSSYFVCLPTSLSDQALMELSNWHYRFIDSDVY